MMNADWTRAVALDAATAKVREAEVLLRDAHDIFVSNSASVEAAHVAFALAQTNNVN